MIGEDSITSLVVGLPINTGNVPSLTHPATASSANGTGSSSETNDPPSTASNVCTAIRERRMASSRSAPADCPLGCVLDCDSHLQERVVLVDVPGRQSHEAAHFLTPPNGPPDDVAVSVMKEFDLVDLRAARIRALSHAPSPATDRRCRRRSRGRLPRPRARLWFRRGRVTRPPTNDRPSFAAASISRRCT